MVLCHLWTFSQATYLTIDCQNPGWLSSMINYGDQLTVKNLKVTGYINKTDLTFIKGLIANYSLNGILDLEEVSIVNPLNKMPNGCLDTNKKLRKFLFPKTLTEAYLCFGNTSVDTVIWTNTSVQSVAVGNFFTSKCHFLYIPEGIQELNGGAGSLCGEAIFFPSTINKIDWSTQYDKTIFSMIENPESVEAENVIYTGYGNSSFCIASNTTFYIPKGTLEKYLASDFAELGIYYYNGNTWTTRPNNNRFIEFYDIDSILCTERILLYIGDIDTIQTDIYPDANLVSWINYSSSNPDIVSVNHDGAVTGIDYGESIITVNPHILIDGLESKTAMCRVRVIKHVEGILMDSTFDVHIGESKQLIARTLPLDITDDNVVFSCDNPTIATVTEKGMISGINRGSCIVTATSVDGGYSAQCVVTVLLPVDGVTMEKHSISLNVGESEQLYATVLPVNADNKKLIWTTSDSEIAEVDVDGNVTAKKCGVAFIKATSDDNPLATDSCKVTVLQPVTGIKLNYSTIELHQIGETVQLVATVLPEDASNKEVRWVSSNESVCMVGNGTVVAVGYGISVIIATTVDGNYMATCTVTVVEGTDLPGDVNHDGEVNIADINAIIDIILGGNADGDTRHRADVNGDGEVNIADINAVIDIILSH